jgi:adenosylhomocysteine nucleosidase
MPRIALVAALKREIAPLVRNWETAIGEYDGRQFTFFVGDDTVAVCGGIGAEAARRATQAVIELYQPERIVSVGFVGALVPELRVGDVVVPSRIGDSRDGSSWTCDGGEGTLVSAMHVTGARGKRKLAEAYNACAVDMEAAAVAQGASLHGIKFAAVKVVSDELDFEVPVVETAVTSDGRFHAGRFLLYVTVRPWLWARVVRLSRNSRRASAELARALRALLVAQETPMKNEVR